MSDIRAILAGGAVSLAIYNTVTQKFGSFGDAVDADKFEIKPNSEEKTSESRKHTDYGQARESAWLPRPTDLNIELSAASARLLALQFQGTVESLTQSSGSLAAVDVTVTDIGPWLPVGKRNLAEVAFEVTNAGDTVTYVLGTHYEVNWSRGEIRFMPGVAGIPAVDDVVKVSGTYGAVDGNRIVGGTQNQIRVMARFDGVNMARPEQVVQATVDAAVLTASNGFDFLASDFVPISLSGKITGAYRIDLPTTAE